MWLRYVLRLPLKNIELRKIHCWVSEKLGVHNGSRSISSHQLLSALCPECHHLFPFLPSRYLSLVWIIYCLNFLSSSLSLWTRHLIIWLPCLKLLSGPQFLVAERLKPLTWPLKPHSHLRLPHQPLAFPVTGTRIFSQVFENIKNLSVSGLLECWPVCLE